MFILCRATSPTQLNILSGQRDYRRDRPGKRPHLFGTEPSGPRYFCPHHLRRTIPLSLVCCPLHGRWRRHCGGWHGGLFWRLGRCGIDAHSPKHMLSIPVLFLLIVLGKLLGSETTFELHSPDRNISGQVIVVILVIGLTSWMYGASIVRAKYLQLARARLCVGGSQALGASRFRFCSGIWFQIHLHRSLCRPRSAWSVQSRPRHMSRSSAWACRTRRPRAGAT